jgi:hypothetical protein
MVAEYVIVKLVVKWFYRGRHIDRAVVLARCYLQGATVVEKML